MYSCESFQITPQQLPQPRQIKEVTMTVDESKDLLVPHVIFSNQDLTWFEKAFLSYLTSLIPHNSNVSTMLNSLEETFNVTEKQIFWVMDKFIRLGLIQEAPDKAVNDSLGDGRYILCLCSPSQIYRRYICSNNLNYSASTDAQATPRALISRQSRGKVIVLHEEPNVPATIEIYLAYWYASDLRKHKGRNTNTFITDVLSLKRLRRGTFFDDKGFNFQRHLGKRFELDSWEKAVDNFALAVNDANYYPKDKTKVKRCGITEFLYNRWTKLSIFLQYLENPANPILTIEDDYPFLTQSMMDIYAEYKGIQSYRPDSYDEKKFILGAKRAVEFFENNDRKIAYCDTEYKHPYSKAEAVWKAIQRSVNGSITITPGFFCSDLTFSSRLPEYLDHIGVWQH